MLGILWAGNYLSVDYDKYAQTWSLIYNTALTCDNNTEFRMFHVVWQCNVKQLSYEVTLSSEIEPCVDQLNIDSIIACQTLSNGTLDAFIYYSEDKTAKLNLSEFVGLNIYSEYNNYNGTYIFYSPGQNGIMCEDDTPITTDIGTLFDNGNSVVGEYIKIPKSKEYYECNDLRASNYKLERYHPYKHTRVEPMYDGEDESWEFRFNASAYTTTTTSTTYYPLEFLQEKDDDNEFYEFIVTWVCDENFNYKVKNALKLSGLSELVIHSNAACQ